MKQGVFPVLTVGILSVDKPIRGRWVVVTEEDTDLLEKVGLVRLMEGQIIGRLSYADEITEELAWKALVRFKCGTYWLYPDQITEVGVFKRGENDEGLIYYVNRRVYVHPDFRVSKHFMARELADSREGVLYFNMVFLATMVEPLRTALRKPFTVNSGCRSKSTNTLVGGHHSSLHLMHNPTHKYVNGTMAMDISTNGWSAKEKEKFVNEATKLGISIGFGSTFFHIDGRTLIGLPRANFNY